MSTAINGDSTRSEGLRRWSAFLVILWIAAFYSNIPVYANLFMVPPIQPVHWMYFLGLASLALWLRPSFWQFPFNAALPGWIVGYCTVCLTWFAGFGGGDTTVLRQRIIALLFLFAIYAVVSASASAVLAARRTIVAVVIGTVAINAYDISHPFVLIPLESEFATAGRAAGLYANPNPSGAALVLGFTLSVGIVPLRWRAAYLMYVGVGVVLTLSRGAMLGLVLVVGLLWWRRVLTTRAIVGATIIGLLAGWWAAIMLLPAIAESAGIDGAFVMDRLMWMVNPGSSVSFSELERAYVAEKGWLQFLNAPILGNGVGSTELWDARASTHNIYITLLSDFGVIGAFVLPLLVVAVTRGRNRSATPERAAFACFVLFWGVVSHNLLNEYYFLIAFATMAAMCSTKLSIGLGSEGVPAGGRWRAA